MIKRTLYFGNPAILSLRNKQLVLRFPEIEKHSEIKNLIEDKGERTFPIEDIGMIILDHPQITITHALVMELMANNVALVSCNEQHLPASLMLTLYSNTLQQERYTNQISASEPLKKQLWSQIVRQKIENQATLLKQLHPNHDVEYLFKLKSMVKSGDSDNREAIAASIYWQKLFGFIPGFVRQRQGNPPNPLLDYGYAILRAIVARSLVEAGLLPTLGIHHHNRYNAYCLADDVMEPYRPFVDKIVYHLVVKYNNPEQLTREIKAELIGVTYVDCIVDDQTSPLQIATLKTARSLQKCFAGEARKLLLPEFPKI